MYADTLEELHQLAELLGMRRSWFQSNGVSLPHYDLTEKKRDHAILLGAIKHDRRQMVGFLRTYRERCRVLPPGPD